LRRATSIRGKITAGYLVSFLFLLVVATILFVTLLVVEDQVGIHLGISRFLDATLEMRRYEKNYLLYGKPEDLDAAREYAASAGALMAAAAGADRHPGWRSLLAEADGETGRPQASPERTLQLLEDYRALLGRAGGLPPGNADPTSAALEGSIREQGRRITEIAERLSSVEGRNIQEMVRASRLTLVVLVVVFLLGTAFIARVVRLTAIRPLRELEGQMQRIASGDYRPLPAGSDEDEIRSMNAAFNRMIQEILAHRQEILRAERLAALGTALAGIAHEINNPLSNISTSAEILREENARAGAEERRELIAQIISQTDRATGIVRAVLDFTRETPFEVRSTSLLSVVRGAAILVGREIPAHVSVRIEVPPDIEVLADRTKLEQAFINLMTNAVDAMREPGRESTLAISARPAGEEEVEVSFRDTGVGIPADLVDRIFDPFFTTKEVGEGTGLGLYLAHQIVEQHRGAIRVESTVGQGTTVIIRLPQRTPRQGAPGRGAGGRSAAEP